MRPSLPRSVGLFAAAASTLLGVGPGFARGGDRVQPASVFAPIMPASDLDREWQDRRLAAEGNSSARTWLELAWWGLERGLTPEAVAALRVGLAAPGAPAVAPLARAGRALERLDSPVGPPDPARLGDDLGATGWIELAGRHVTLLHQGHDPAAAAERLDVLDRVVDTYYLGLAIQGIELDVPRRRLVSTWFARQADYIAHLRRVGAGPFVNTQGFFHPTARVVYAFDTRSAAEQDLPRRAIERRRLAPDLTTARRVDLDRQVLLLDLAWREVDLGIAAHETVHQLVDASDLAPRADAFPNWLHEGLAAQFEVVRDGRWAGFGRTNDRRLADWRSARERPRIAPLLRDDGLTHGYQRARYAEAWALVYFLRKTRPTEFVAYLDRLRAPRPTGDSTPPTVAFEAAFGPGLDQLERDWFPFMARQAPSPRPIPRLISSNPRRD